MIWWPLVVVFLVVAGRVWVGLPLRWRRPLAWAVLVLALIGIEWGLRDRDPILRMVGLCCCLLGGLKGIAYQEWHRETGKTLGWGRYLGFGFAWFGMDPGAFARQTKDVEWRSHLLVGCRCMAVGTALALVVRAAGWTSLLLVFVPMSLGFHFGALRVLTACWRAAGFPARVLFRNPLATTGLADFWSRRWNLGYSEMMVRVVKRPCETVWSRPASEGVVFLLSGLLHEVAITIPVGAGYGLPTLYFLLNGLAVRLERPAWSLWAKRLWTAIWVLGPVSLLFPVQFQEEVILRCLYVLPQLGVD